MYIYNIGYHSYEESDYIQNFHKKKINKKGLEDIIIKATVNVFKSHEVKKDKGVTFQYILYDVVEELIKNFGFKEVEFTSQFNIFGWANILDEKDWEGDRDEQLKKLTKSIKNDIK